MPMTKKDFIKLADAIRDYNEASMRAEFYEHPFDDHQLDCLAEFCAEINPRFDRSRWLGYIEGTNGPSGGQRDR